MRLIDANTLCATIEFWIEKLGKEQSASSGFTCYVLQNVVDYIKTVPSIERTAEWIVQDDTFTRFECSRCHTKHHHTRWNYCPSCGSLMENKEDG